MANKLTHTKLEFDPIYQEIKAILTEARNRTWRAVNAEMVTAYWNIGRVIVQKEQQGQERAQYGKQLVEVVSKELQRDFGKGFAP